MAASDVTVVGSYMPAPLAAELRSLARRNDRTASSQIRHLVREAVGETDRSTPRDDETRSTP